MGRDDGRNGYTLTPENEQHYRDYVARERSRWDVAAPLARDLVLEVEMWLDALDAERRAHAETRATLDRLTTLRSRCRAEALEEAAKVCDQYVREWGAMLDVDDKQLAYGYRWRRDGGEVLRDRIRSLAVTPDPKEQR